MPHRSWELRVVDIVDAIEIVLDYTAGMTLEQFVSDRKTIDAVVRNHNWRSSFSPAGGFY